MKSIEMAHNFHKPLQFDIVSSGSTNHTQSLMDHLPRPIESAGHVDVYIYAPPMRKVYHPQDFFSLPGEYKCDFEHLLEHGLSKTWSRGHCNEFLQSWLFFALLAQVTNTEIQLDDFYREEEKLRTGKLVSLIPEWKNREKGAVGHSETCHQARECRYVRASMALDAARRFVAKHCSHIRMDYDHQFLVRDEVNHPAWDTKCDDRLDPNLTLSLAILGETLQLERPPMPSGSYGCRPFHNDPGSQERDWGYSKYCRNQLQRHGWCPFEIRRLESTLASVIKLYYVCERLPPQPELDHSKCSFRSCIAKQNDYEALHVNGCDARCSKHTLKEGQLVDIISKKLTPLVTWTNAGKM